MGSTEGRTGLGETEGADDVGVGLTAVLFPRRESTTPVRATARTAAAARLAKVAALRRPEEKLNNRRV